MLIKTMFCLYYRLWHCAGFDLRRIFVDSIAAGHSHRIVAKSSLRWKCKRRNLESSFASSQVPIEVSIYRKSHSSNSSNRCCGSDLSSLQNHLNRVIGRSSCFSFMRTGSYQKSRCLLYIRLI